VADRHPDDRFISAQSGEIVSDEFAKENPDTTYLREGFTDGEAKPKPVNMDPLEVELLDSIGRLALADDGDYRDADAVRKDCARIVDALIAKAGLPLKLQDLNFSEALDLCKNGMAIKRQDSNVAIRFEPPGRLVYREEDGAVTGQYYGSSDDLLAEDWRAL
jgi:hypothetical protein